MVCMGSEFKNGLAVSYMENDMGLDVTKSVLGVFGKMRLKHVCSSIETRQNMKI